VSTKIGELSLEFSCTIVETVNTEKPSGPTFDREKNLHVWLFCCELFQARCMLFTWVVRTCLLMDYSDASYVTFTVCYSFLYYISLST
jgi:hypothetical protein